MALSPLLVVPGEGLCLGSAHKAKTGPLFAISDLESLA